MRAAGAESDRASFGRQKLTRVCVCVCVCVARQPSSPHAHALHLLYTTQHNTTQHNTTQHNTMTLNNAVPPLFCSWYTCLPGWPMSETTCTRGWSITVSAFRLSMPYSGPETCFLLKNSTCTWEHTFTSASISVSTSLEHKLQQYRSHILREETSLQERGRSQSQAKTENAKNPGFPH